MMALCELQGVVVCANRTGEHLAAQEHGPIAKIVHEVGAALFALRTQAAEARALASEAQLNEVRAQAKSNEALLNEARARETTLMETLRVFNATAKSWHGLRMSLEFRRRPSTRTWPQAELGSIQTTVAPSTEPPQSRRSRPSRLGRELSPDE